MFLSRHFVRTSRFGTSLKRQLSYGPTELSKNVESIEEVEGSSQAAPQTSTETFASLFRKSKLVQIGDPCGKVRLLV